MRTWRMVGRLVRTTSPSQQKTVAGTASRPRLGLAPSAIGAVHDPFVDRFGATVHARGEVALFFLASVAVGFVLRCALGGCVLGAVTTRVGRSARLGWRV